MKFLLKIILILFIPYLLLFILSACTQQEAEPQAATATQEVTATTDLIAESEIEQKGEYPQNSENFIFGDSRTNDDIEKAVQDIIDNPEYGYSEILNLYRAKLDQMGVDNNNYRAYISTNPEGPGWTLTMVKGNEMYIPITKEGVPHADLIISPSASLDSFSLLKITNSRIVWDKSNWPVIVNNSNAEWYAMGQSPIEWRKINNVNKENIIEKPPIQESELIINPEYPIINDVLRIDNFEAYSPITFEDISSGKLLDTLKKHIKENPPFKESVLTTNSLLGRRGLYHEFTMPPGETADPVDIEYVIIDNQHLEYNDEGKRPIKAISFFPIVDNDFLENEFNWESRFFQADGYTWILALAYKNPSGSDRVILLHVRPFWLNEQKKRCENEGRDLQVIITGKIGDLGNINRQESELFYRYDAIYLTKFLREIYPNLTPPESDFKTWIKTGEMSENLEKSLFAWSRSVRRCWW